jgi:hypothetical protein
MKRYFLLTIILALTLTGTSFPQATKKQLKEKLVVLNPRQIDFMQRLDSDLRRPINWENQRGTIIYGAYGRNLYYITQRIKAGLRDSSNLLAVMRGWKSFSSMGYYEKLNDHLKAETFQNLMFFSVTVEECHDLLQMTDDEIQGLANKYADYYQQIDIESKKMDAKIKKLPKY